MSQNCADQNLCSLAFVNSLSWSVTGNRAYIQKGDEDAPVKPEINGRIQHEYGLWVDTYSRPLGGTPPHCAYGSALPAEPGLARSDGWDVCTHNLP